MILTLGTSPAVGRSMVFDRFEIDEVNRAKDVLVSPAGKSVNVSRVLRSLGHDVVATGIVGGDTGKVVLEEMTSLGVADAWLRSGAPTRVCVTIIDRAAGQVTELVEEAPPATAEDEAALLSIVETWMRKCSVVVCSGTIAKGLSDDLYALVAARCAGGPRVIVDARGEVLKKSCQYGPIIKCNASELRDTFGGTLEHALTTSLDAGAAAAVISDGRRPTTIAYENLRWTIDTPEVTVLSPIGSGDSMAAGLAAGLERGWSIEEAAKLGVACAAANAQTSVAGKIDPAEAKRLFDRLTPVRQQ